MLASVPDAEPPGVDAPRHDEELTVQYVSQPSRPFEDVGDDRDGMRASRLARGVLRGPAHAERRRHDPLRGDTPRVPSPSWPRSPRERGDRLGTLVASATYRHPAVFAKAMTAIDQVSQGRAICHWCGWQENQRADYGIGLGSITKQIDPFDDYVTIVHSMLTEETTTFEGCVCSLHDAPNDPRPVQRDCRSCSACAAGDGQSHRPPGTRRSGTHGRPLRTWPSATRCSTRTAQRDRPRSEDHRALTQALVFLSTDEAWLARHREGAGRASIVGTPAEVTEIVGRYRAAGCDEFIVPCFTLGSLDRCLETLELFSRDVASHFVG